MHEDQKYYHYILKVLIIYCAIQTDILLLETGQFMAAPLTLIFCIFFIIQENYFPLTILFLMSLPLSLIHYQISGLHLCLYIILYFLNALFQRSIYIKKLIPYLLLLSFLTLQELYFYLYTAHPFLPQTFLIKAIIFSAAQFLLSPPPFFTLLDKKK
jgi:hypothetical protein